MAAPKLERLKAADVCQLAQVQPYVLRSWEAEFPDLGQVTAGGPRIYGRADVERVLRSRELIVGEGLTLAGARRRLEAAVDDDLPTTSAEEFSLVDEQTRVRLRSVRVLFAAQTGVAPPTFVMFTNVAAELHFSYIRYLTNRLREEYGFAGTPIRLHVRRRSSARKGTESR